MQKLKQNRGITLIALIITIIVMLILVTVSITVALNGGLFKKAEDAATLTTIEQEKEALNMAAISAWESGTGVDFENMEIPDGFVPAGNGKYSKNLNTGLTLQDDFVTCIYQPLLNKNKVLKKQLN